jgi:uncharacterized protein (UPF0332 family)
LSYSKKAQQAMLRKAAEKLASAKDDYKSARYDSCISNLYYSAFQTVTSLLIARGDLLSKHTHVRAFVNRELASRGLLDKSLAKMYNKLMDLRSDADYNSDVFFDQEIAKELLIGVEQFNEAIMELIKKQIRIN